MLLNSLSFFHILTTKVPFVIEGVALASTLQLSPEAMATCWEAFSLTNKVSELTSYTFDAYKTQLHKHSEIASPLMTGKGAIQSRNAKRQFSTHMVTPPTTKRHQTHNNKESTFSFVSVAIQATNVPLSTPEDEAAAIPVVKYDERTKAGQVAASFNPKEWPAISFKLPGTKHRCVIDSQDFSYGANITENYRHMFTVSEDRAYALEKHLRRVGKEIIDKYGIGNGENGVAPLEQLIVPRQDAVCCIGRICNEASEIGNRRAG